MRPDLVVLCYHGVSDSWPDETAVGAADLVAHVESFLRDGYRGQTFTGALTAPRAERVLAVTFDDAAESVWSRAAAPLADLGVPATVFVPTDYPDSGEPMSWQGLERWVGTAQEPELASMGWEQLADLAGRGWEIGSHTCSHPDLRGLGDAELERELVASRRECETRLGRPCHALAYPYGFADARLAAVARTAGYATAATVPTGPAPPLPLQWPRVGVYRGDSARRVRLRARARALGLVPGAARALALARRVT